MVKKSAKRKPRNNLSPSNHQNTKQILTLNIYYHYFKIISRRDLLDNIDLIDIEDPVVHAEFYFPSYTKGDIYKIENNSGTLMKEYAVSIILDEYPEIDKMIEFGNIGPFNFDERRKDIHEWFLKQQWIFDPEEKLRSPIHAIIISELDILHTIDRYELMSNILPNFLPIELIKIMLRYNSDELIFEIQKNIF